MVVRNMSNDPLLEVKNLKTYFFVGDQTFKAVDGVSFNINKGEILSIVGESGSGKSVTSLSILGLVQKQSGKIVDGEIRYNGKDISKLSNKELTSIRGKEISMIFQEPMSSLNPVLTIGFQIIEAIRRHNKISKREAKKRAIELLKQVGIARANEIYDDYPHQLSGGMRQRVMIAIAISCNPNLLIADEPTTALDVTIQAQILDLMKRVKDEFDSSILLITHDLGVVAEMADRVVVMYAGQIVEEAPVKELFDHPKHPYTKGLMESIPKIDEKKKRLNQIEGVVPPSNSFTKGCRFAPRCKFAMPECLEQDIDLEEINKDHKVRCLLYENQNNSSTEVN